MDLYFIQIMKAQKVMQLKKIQKFLCVFIGKASKTNKNSRKCRKVSDSEADALLQFKSLRK